MLALKEKTSEAVLPSFLVHVLRRTSSVFDSEMVPAVLGHSGMAHRRLGPQLLRQRTIRGQAKHTSVSNTRDCEEHYAFCEEEHTGVRARHCPDLPAPDCTGGPGRSAERQGLERHPESERRDRWQHPLGVAAVSASDVWAVGTHGSSSGNRALTERWNGSSWSIVKSPNAGTSFNSLKSVAVASTSDIWAVGDYSSGEGYAQTLTERWNGSSWSIVKSLK